MKRIYAIISILLACLLSLCGCGGKTSDGLWLYKGNERMRTDGSERESLLGEVNLDGKTYGEEDYSVAEYIYCTDTGFVFFDLVQEENHYLYIYDYINKEGKQFGEAWTHLWMCQSDAYVYINLEKDALFRRDGTFVYSPSGACFDGDILWNKDLDAQTGELRFDWWKSGQEHSVTFFDFGEPRESYLEKRYIQHAGDYMYLVGEHAAFCVNLNTGDYSRLSFVGERVQVTTVGSDCYILTSGLFEDYYDAYQCRLYGFKNGLSCSLLHQFEPEVRVHMSDRGIQTENGSAVNFSYGNNPYGNDVCCYFSNEDWGMHEGSIAQNQTIEKEQLVVGKYTFWVEMDSILDYWNVTSSLYRKHGLSVQKIQSRTEKYRIAKLSDFLDDIREV